VSKPVVYSPPSEIKWLCGTVATRVEKLAAQFPTRPHALLEQAVKHSSSFNAAIDHIIAHYCDISEEQFGQFFSIQVTVYPAMLTSVAMLPGAFPGF
jgi:hypothetical protein